MVNIYNLQFTCLPVYNSITRLNYEIAEIFAGIFSYAKAILYQNHFGSEIIREE